MNKNLQNIFLIFLFSASSYFTNAQSMQILPQLEKDTAENKQLAPYVNEKNANNSFDFSVFPNPAKEIVNIQFDFANNKKVDFQIFDYLGNIIYTGQIEKEGTSNIKTLRIETLRQGIYFIQLKLDEKVITKQFKKI
ncbi:MAG TPA: hypothetical protein DDX39_05620 [Bacteroidales bacterium]|nr:MAG: hypothetical protein A2W98_06890 [Bacteroidetes bacterium GWF2_33_38]OFY76168.1 MAG: hypothetical protein A2265_09560 [Bacteroidetes bacterium RIFOXYA12_FULL_33_9]HBF88102.1 hypothetical protein [Bacteroidales bacterium]